MRLDRLDADTKTEGNFLVNVAFGHLLNHLSLTMGQDGLGGCRLAFKELVQERV